MNDEHELVQKIRRTPERVMLDGSKTGAYLEREGNSTGNIDSGSNESDVEIDRSEAKLVHRMMKTCPTYVKSKSEWTVTLENNGSHMQLALRRDNRNSKIFYLNLSGNTLTFLSGSNSYGLADPVKQVQVCWRMCLKRLEDIQPDPPKEEQEQEQEQEQEEEQEGDSQSGEYPPDDENHRKGPRVPERIYRIIDKREIHIHSLEFALYTNKTEYKEDLLDFWHAMFHGTRIRVTREINGRERVRTLFLAEMLGVQWTDNEWRNSLRFKILNKHKRRHIMLSIYDKAEEIRARNRQIEEGLSVKAKRGDRKTESGLPQDVPPDIEDRLRVDIHLMRTWLHDRGIRTLAHFEEWINRPPYYGSWITFLKHETQALIDKLYLVRIFELDADAVIAAYRAGELVYKTGREIMPIERALALIWARTEYHMDSANKLEHLDPENLEKLQKRIRRQRNQLPFSEAARQLSIDTTPPKRKVIRNEI